MFRASTEKYPSPELANGIKRSPGPTIFSSTEEAAGAHTRKRQPSFSNISDPIPKRMLMASLDVAMLNLIVSNGPDRRKDG
jgi:hypothetical protein